MTQSCLVGGALSLAMDTPRLESLEMAEWGGERNCSGCGGGGGLSDHWEVSRLRM
jgi:hypothetical protein